VYSGAEICSGLVCVCARVNARPWCLRVCFPSALSACKRVCVRERVNACARVCVRVIKQSTYSDAQRYLKPKPLNP
jgi:hypothetical protein